jgi:hypothetical protein
MEIKILDSRIDVEDLRDFSQTWYLDFLKGCVDLENRKVAVGGDYHIESCELLTSAGGKHTDIWGFNIRFLDNKKYLVEFDSLVNIKPKINNGRMVNDLELQDKICELIKEYIIF